MKRLFLFATIWYKVYTECFFTGPAQKVLKIAKTLTTKGKQSNFHLFFRDFAIFNTTTSKKTNLYFLRHTLVRMQIYLKTNLWIGLCVF